MRNGLNGFLALLTALTVGCGALKKEPEPVPAMKPAPAAVSSSTLRASLVEGAGPQSYRVTLDWSGVATTPAWRLYRESDRRPREALAIAEGASSHSDDSGLPGERLKYLLTDAEGDASPQRFTAEVAVPRDLEIIGRRSIRSITGVHRLFLRAGAMLVGEDGQLEVRVDEIHSEGGTMAAFAPDVPAPAGQAGRPGRHVVVKAARGSGVLNLWGNGENGGCGLPGLAGNVGAPGRQGYASVPDFAAIALAHVEDVFGQRPQTGLLGPPNQTTARPKRNFCSQPPTDGTPGERGGKGQSGGTGLLGGDAAKIFVQLHHPAGLEVRALSVPGRGGEGGDGGPGGAGGVGGLAGLCDRPHCPEAKNGPNGEAGPKGDAGTAGPAGAPAPICLKLGAAVQGDCAAFPEIPPFID